MYRAFFVCILFAVLPILQYLCTPICPSYEEEHFIFIVSAAIVSLCGDNAGGLLRPN